nr:unnamed protein product [Spirometra erinaceieuropaei]
MQAVCTCQSCLHRYLREYKTLGIGPLLAGTNCLSSTTAPSEDCNLGETLSTYLQENHGVPDSLCSLSLYCGFFCHELFTLTHRILIRMSVEKLVIHLVWLGSFHDIFLSSVDRQWQLVPFDATSEFPEDKCLWQGIESAKVRFTCSDCGRIWTSISALATFVLCVDPIQWSRLTLWFSLAGQTCSTCLQETANRSFSPDKRVVHYGAWYPREVVRVLLRVHRRIMEDVFAVRQN